jgi:hypothetical protein
MDMPMCLPTVARGILLDMTFSLIFITRTATSQPVQTNDEILQSGEYIVIIVAVKILPFIFHRITRVFVKAGFLDII